MKRLNRILTILLCVFELTSVYGQIDELDTVFVKKTIGDNEFEIDTLYIPRGRSSQQVLAGTTFLPYSDKIIGLLNKGLSPISLELIQECDNNTDPKTFKDYPKFIEVKRDSITLTVDVSIVANCCHNFLGEAEVVGNDTLNLVYTSFGSFCSFACCFTLRYKFNTTTEAQYHILKYLTINGSTTVGKIPRKE